MSLAGWGVPDATVDRLLALRVSKHDGEPLIGNRTCRNCRRTLFDHCEAHAPPCCPGNCPGPAHRWLAP